MVEQDHRFIKRLVKPGLGFFSFETAWRTLQGFEAMNMKRKGQIQCVEKGSIKAQPQYATPSQIRYLSQFAKNQNFGKRDNITDFLGTQSE